VSIQGQGRGGTSRRAFLGTLGAGALAALTIRELRAQAPALRKPNIVVILADDLGYGGIGVQGCTDIPTPNIDSIARDGIRFTSGYASCPLCSPTRAGLQTGRYQQRFGHEFNPGANAISSETFYLAEDEVTLAERLKPLGYTTGMFGKWHLGYREGSRPTERGYDEFYGFLGAAHPYTPAAKTAPIYRGIEPVEAPPYLTDAFGREAVSFIERHKSEPFYLYVPFNAVHSPLQATEQYLDRFAGITDEKRRTHAAMLSALDDNVGLVLTALRDQELEKDTLLVFLSDNGGPTTVTTSSNLPLRGYKGQMWEGGIRIPYMVRWPGILEAGKVLDKPVVSLDIHPTAVVAAGGTVDPAWKLDGVDIMPFLKDPSTAPPHETLCWRMGEIHAIRDGDWKLVAQTGEDAPRLYNLEEDISETHDLAADSPDKLRELTEKWGAWSAQMAAPRWGREERRQGAGAAETFAERWKRLDKDGDGKLSEAEVGKPGAFRQLDTNGDGGVSKDEARGRLAKLGL
jgi:arylsulfatase A-like enzyme